MTAAFPHEPWLPHCDFAKLHGDHHWQPMEHSDGWHDRCFKCGLMREATPGGDPNASRSQ